MFSNHDVVRHATRYALAAGTSPTAWLLDGADPTLEDRALGLKRARAATLLALALPGSMYLYQGEELGLPEVADIPDSDKQDPAFFRNKGSTPGRDGCRVPLPWSSNGPSFGFGSGAAHLPQPAWFGTYAVDVEAEDPDSTLSFYRRALELRHRLQRDEAIDWMEHDDPVVSFRQNGKLGIADELRRGTGTAPGGHRADRERRVGRSCPPRTGHDGVDATGLSA